jgi:alpha-mannosidase
VGPYAARLDLIIPGRGGEIRANIRLEGHWQEPPMTGWVSFTVPSPDNATTTVDVPFGVESRAPDTEVYAGRVPDDRDYGLVEMFERLRPGWFWARSWVDASDETGGVSLIHVDGNVYWQKQGARIGPVLMRAQLRTPGTWEARTALSMNGSGIHDFSVAVRLHDGPAPTVDLQRRSAELHHPSVVIRGNHPAEAQLPDTHSFLAVDGPAQVSAVHRDGGDLIVRVWEHSGTGGDVTLSFDRAVSGATIIDHIGNLLDHAVTIDGDRVVATLRPWQIATFRLAM